MTDHAQEILDTYTDDAGPIPADRDRRNAWYRGLVWRAFRAARVSHEPVALRRYDRLGRKLEKTG